VFHFVHVYKKRTSKDSHRSKAPRWCQKVPAFHIWKAPVRGLVYSGYCKRKDKTMAHGSLVVRNSSCARAVYFPPINLRKRRTPSHIEGRGGGRRRLRVIPIHGGDAPSKREKHIEYLYSRGSSAASEFRGMAARNRIKLKRTITHEMTFLAFSCVLISHISVKMIRSSIYHPLMLSCATFSTTIRKKGID
jgi:hypothetical protein